MREESPNHDQMQGALGDRKIFDFKLFVQEEFLHEALTPQYVDRVSFQDLNMIQIAQTYNCESVYLDESMQIPDMPGKTLVFKSDSVDNKYEAINNVLRRLLEV